MSNLYRGLHLLQVARIDVCGSISVHTIALGVSDVGPQIVFRELWVRKSACSGCWLLRTVHGLCQLCAQQLMCAAVQPMKLDQTRSKRSVLRWRLASALHCSNWTSEVSGRLVAGVAQLRCCGASS